MCSKESAGKSSRSARVSSVSPGYMSPTKATMARQRSTSAEPTASTTQHSTKGSSKTRIPSSGANLVSREESSKRKKGAAKSNQEGSAVAERNLSDDEHAERKSRMGDQKFKITTVKEATEKWSKEWRARAELVINYPRGLLKKFNVETGEVEVIEPKEEVKEAIKEKQEREEDAWARRHKGGYIDENGKHVRNGGGFCRLTKKALDEMKEVKKEAKKDPLRKVESGRVEKKKTVTKTPSTTVPEASSAVPAPVHKSTAGSTAGKSTQQAAIDSTSKSTPKVRKPDEEPETPNPGRPTYGEYGYNECAALCSQRNIKSGGGVQAVRNKLIRDDKLVDAGEFDKRDAKNYNRLAREKKTIAPTVEGAPPLAIERPATYLGKAPKPALEPTSKQTSKQTLKQTPKPTSKQTLKRGRDEDEDEQGDEQPKVKKMKLT